MSRSGPDSTSATPGRPFGATLLLSVTLIVGLAAFLIPVLMLVVSPVVIPGGVPASEQNSESLAFAITFLVFLPVAAWRVPLYADGFEGRPGRDALTAIATGLCFTSGLVVAAVRVSEHLPWGGGVGIAAVAFGLWLLFALVVTLWGRRDPLLSRLSGLGARRQLVWALAGSGVALAILSFVNWGHVDAAVLLPGLVLLVVGFYVLGRIRLPDLPRKWGRLLDGAVILLTLLAVPDMVIFPNPGPGGVNLLDAYPIQFHQNLFLGPASQVLEGKVLLVDTVSQYGIAPIYLISAFFEIAPIGHGTLGFLDGFLSALVVGTGYLIMRMAGVRRVIAIPAIAVAVIIVAWGVTYPMGALLQHGALRFGLPIPLIAAAVAGTRWPRFGRPLYWLCLFVVGLSSIWALESFLYTLFTWIAITLVSSVWQESGVRRRWLLRQVLMTGIALVAAQVAFALITLAVSGELPDWSLYLNYLREFLFGDVGDVTFNYAPWSSAVTVAAFYLATVVAIVQLIWSRSDYVVANRTAFLALTGSLAYGIAIYTYFLNRSLDFVLPYFMLPLVLVVAIGLGLIISDTSAVPRQARLTMLGAAAAVALIAIAGVATSVPGRAADSLLAYAVPGGPSLRSGFHRLWNPPPLVAGAREGERLLNQEMPGESSSAVIIASDASVEALARAKRANSLGFTDPKENSWVPGPNRPIIRDAVDQLEPGDLMLVDQSAFDFIDTLDEYPGIDPGDAAFIVRLESLQGYALALIDEKYRLVTVARGAEGLRVVRLESR